MKKILLVLFSVLFLTTVGLAQTPQNTAKDAPKAPPAVEDKKSPPITVLPPEVGKELSALQTAKRIWELELENARLKAANAEMQLKMVNDTFSQSFNAAIQKAGGIPGDGNYRWDILPDGAWRVIKEEKSKQ